MKIPFMPMGVMTGRYFQVGKLNANVVARTLRGRYKDMDFSVVRGLFPGSRDKILAGYKDKGKEVDQDIAENIEMFIYNMRRDE